MTLTEICHKYKISDSFLGSKEDGLVVASISIGDLVREMKAKNGDEAIIKKLERLAEFMREVKNSNF